MRNTCIKYAVLFALTGIFTGCSSPSYIDKADENAVARTSFSKVLYHIHDTYNSEPPKCLAVLPLNAPKDRVSTANNISLDQTETVRRALYAHLSPQGKYDVEIPRVDFVLKQMSDAGRNNLSLVGEKLNCDALIVGEVTEYGSSYFALYSRVAVGADLKMIRASDGELLWEGQHVAESHGGEFPLSPVGLAMGLIDAAKNVDEEQVFRMIDDLARRLVKTIPDNRVAVLEEQISPVQVAVRRLPEKAKTANNFLSVLADEPQNEQKVTLIEAIKEGLFDDDGTRKLYDALILLDPNDVESHSRYSRYLAEQGDYSGALGSIETALGLDGRDHAMHFLKANILIKSNDLDGADAAIVRAVALDDSKAVYFNGLGYVNSVRGNSERALAAYRMALKRDPANGFAYYNTGVTLFNLSDMEAAADAFYGAGLAYFKSGDYGQVEKIAADLKDLASRGLDLEVEIQTLEKALETLTKGEGKDV
jgi:tetratricopeptide (TPR) repeat protein